MNEINIFAWLNIIDGVIIFLITLLWDFIAPRIGIYHAQGIGTLQVVVAIYGFIKIGWGIYLVREW